MAIHVKYPLFNVIENHISASSISGLNKNSSTLYVNKKIKEITKNIKK
jgi:hypothetical protein